MNALSETQRYGVIEQVRQDTQTELDQLLDHKQWRSQWDKYQKAHPENKELQHKFRGHKTVYSEKTYTATTFHHQRPSLWQPAVTSTKADHQMLCSLLKLSKITRLKIAGGTMYCMPLHV